MRDLKGLHHGALPLNARVTVDYAKHRVSFRYPTRVAAKKAILEAMGLWEE